MELEHQDGDDESENGVTHMLVPRNTSRQSEEGVVVSFLPVVPDVLTQTSVACRRPARTGIIWTVLEDMREPLGDAPVREDLLGDAVTARAKPSWCGGCTRAQCSCAELRSFETFLGVVARRVLQRAVQLARQSRSMHEFV